MGDNLKDIAGIALNLAALVGKLSAVVHWCVEHDGECLADNPHQLEEARRILAEATEKMHEHVTSRH